MVWSIKDKLLGKPQASAQRIKAEVIGHYGTECACCKESNLVFLVIDHVNGGGHKEHSRVGHGTTFYRWLRKNNYPSGYQILCHNCNFAKRLGPCPHYSPT